MRGEKPQINLLRHPLLGALTACMPRRLALPAGASRGTSPLWRHAAPVSTFAPCQPGGRPERLPS